MYVDLEFNILTLWGPGFFIAYRTRLLIGGGISNVMEWVGRRCWANTALFMATRSWFSKQAIWVSMVISFSEGEHQSHAVHHRTVNTSETVAAGQFNEHIGPFMPLIEGRICIDCCGCGSDRFKLTEVTTLQYTDAPIFYIRLIPYKTQGPVQGPQNNPCSKGDFINY